jgi:branched-subunit amino acid transport protein
MARHIFQSIWSIFLYPMPPIRLTQKVKLAHAYHGRLSSASTGRLAALLFPFVVLSEPNITVSCTAGASTSMSSSKSDILTLVSGISQLLEWMQGIRWTLMLSTKLKSRNVAKRVWSATAIYDKVKAYRQFDYDWLDRYEGDL